MSSIEIRCGNDGCNALFGKVKDGILTIKSRDLERHFSGGIVWGRCRRCGITIEWRADDTSRLRQAHKQD
jgi:hypothetical protein